MSQPKAPLRDRLLRFLIAVGTQRLRLQREHGRDVARVVALHPDSLEEIRALGEAAYARNSRSFAEVLGLERCSRTASRCGRDLRRPRPARAGGSAGAPSPTCPCRPALVPVEPAPRRDRGHRARRRPGLRPVCPTDRRTAVVTDLALRLLEALYSIPGLAALLRLPGRVVTALLPSSVSLADAAILFARLCWYGAQVVLLAAIVAAVGAAAYGVVCATAYVIDRVGARETAAR